MLFIFHFYEKLYKPSDTFRSRFHFFAIFNVLSGIIDIDIRVSLFLFLFYSLKALLSD